MRVWIAIWTGSACISTTIAGWLVAGGAGATFGKLVLVLFVAGFVKGLPWTTNIALLLAVAWLVTAVAVGLYLPDPTKQAQTQADKGTDETPQQPAPTPDGITRAQLVQALHEVGAPHAHTTAIADHLKTSTAAVREALAEARIPLSGGVRMKGRPVPVSPGVKRGDFPPLPSPDEEGGTEGLLTSNNNDNNNAATFETVPDEERPHRTLVRWLKATK